MGTAGTGDGSHASADMRFHDARGGTHAFHVVRRKHHVRRAPGDTRYGLQCQSVRSAIRGSTRIARRVGINVAALATMPKPMATVM